LTSASRSLRDGDFFVYHVDYRNSSQSNIQPVFEDMKKASPNSGSTTAPVGLKRTVDASLYGKLELTILRHENENFLVMFRMPEIELKLIVDGANAVVEKEIIRRELKNGIYALLSPRGSIAGVSFDSSIDVGTQSVIRTLLALTQCVLPHPEQQNWKQWEVEELDQTGRYRIRYSQLQDKLPHKKTVSLKKEKLRYIQPKVTKSRSKAAMLIEYIPSGAFSISLDSATGNIRSIKGEEKLKIIMSDRDVGQSETSFALVQKNRTSLNKSKLESFKKTYQVFATKNTFAPLWSPSMLDADEQLLHRKQLGTSTLENLLTELWSAEQLEDKSKFNATDLYLKFKAIIFLQPNSCLKIGKVAGEAKPQSLTNKLLIGALASIGNPDAQRALVDIIRNNKSNTNVMIQLIPTLGMVEEPTQFTADALKEIALSEPDGEISSTAKLVLGIVARNLEEINPEYSYKMIEEITSHYLSTDNVDDICLMIHIFGNSGFKRYLPKLLEYAEDRRITVRSNAIYALRSFDRDEVITRIVMAMQSDINPTVRFEASRAIAFQEMDNITIEATINAFNKETVKEVRQELLRTLWKFEKKYVQIRHLVKTVAEKDEDEDVRKAAQNMVNLYPDEYFRQQ
jgi:hypothetical protein